MLIQMKKMASILIASALLLCGCREIRKKKQPVQVPVRVEEVACGTMEAAHSYVGTITADKAVTLSFETGGALQRVCVRAGQKVAKGTLLAELDNRTALNAYQAAKVTLERAEDGYRRAESVYRQGSLPEVKWVEIQTQLNQAKSMAEICKKNLENCNMYAPQSGTIGNIQAEAGMNIMPFQPVMQLLDMSRISVSVSIPEKEIASLRIGQSARVSVQALEAVFEAKVTEIGVVADPLSHAYPVSLQVARPDAKLLPGMVCRVEMADADTGVTSIEIPAKTVQISNDGREFVWLCIDGKAHKAFITTGGFTANGVRVTEGLKPGDRIITDGSQKISENTLLQIK